MHTHNVVAFFSSLAGAEAARSRLIAAGIDQSSIRLSNQGSTSRAASSSTRSDEDKGFFEWLFGTDDDVPEHERSWYSGNLTEGRAALSVRLSSDAELNSVEQILEAEGALEVDRHDNGAAIGETPPRSSMTSGAMSPGQRSSTSGEQVIPVVKEELAVGKRQQETRRRIRTHVIERPVSEQVQLQDETVVVERRPATGATAGTGLQEREYEVIERREEPVVEKRARADEEIVVKKDVRTRTETVDGTVRETEVEVDGENIRGTQNNGR